jgi:hypothetical protein
MARHCPPATFGPFAQSQPSRNPRKNHFQAPKRITPGPSAPCAPHATLAPYPTQTLPGHFLTSSLPSAFDAPRIAEKPCRSVRISRRSVRHA